jgi:hypothetical protein
MDETVSPADRGRQNPQHDARGIRDDAPGGVRGKGAVVPGVIRHAGINRQVKERARMNMIVSLMASGAKKRFPRKEYREILL